MSKIINSLKEALKARDGMCSLESVKIANRRPNESSRQPKVHLAAEEKVMSTALTKRMEEVTKEDHRLSTPAAKATLRIGWAFAAMFILLLSVNVGFFLVLRNYTQASNSAMVKLDRIEETLNKSNNLIFTLSKQIDKTNETLASTNKDIQKSESRLEKLEKNIDSQATAIENLVKAKKTLFNKVSSLETEIERLKNISQTKVNSQ